MTLAEVTQEISVDNVSSSEQAMGGMKRRIAYGLPATD